MSTIKQKNLVWNENNRIIIARKTIFFFAKNAFQRYVMSSVNKYSLPGISLDFICRRRWFSFTDTATEPINNNLLNKKQNVFFSPQKRDIFNAFA